MIWKDLTHGLTSLISKQNWVWPMTWWLKMSKITDHAITWKRWPKCNPNYSSKSPRFTFEEGIGAIRQQTSNFDFFWAEMWFMFAFILCNGKLLAASCHKTMQIRHASNNGCKGEDTTAVCSRGGEGHNTVEFKCRIFSNRPILIH